MSNQDVKEIKYYFYSIEFKPFADKRDTHNNHKICIDTLYHLANIKQQGKGLLKDRNENRAKLPKREMFLSSATIIPKERRARFTMALIRKGRRPKIKKKGTFNLESITNIGEVVEVTHFFVDFGSDKNFICVEKNHNGANIADIEYYLKMVARDDLQLARTADLTVYMNDTLDNALQNVKNVLSFNIKMRPSNLDLINEQLKTQFFNGFEIVSKVYRPEFLRVEAFFKKQGRKIEERKKNKIATNMFNKALKVFKKDPTETFYYDQFDVVFEDGTGNEDSFNLLKDKKIISKLIEDSTDLSLKESYNLINDDFTQVVNDLK
ncbi:hypothetical protein SAMN05444483_1015 [Salegentibacter echinorum]|uniref:Uncharacterized protein n=1 Tax=Salegentibacter echinorum TaxID=1073325 RepID=A0A1M5BFL9_SALEC|nr:hypothetical protein [Salegentibacter echinorum]SHF41117.1 hypothetical protein SAMN05444483_1015 [Salegentibacter echinorum]